MSNIITRAPSTNNGTFGLWSIDDAPACVTCELPWINNQKGISCIPNGIYHCIRHISAKFPLGNTWEVTGSMLGSRTGILIHNANDIADLEGCIATGSGFGIVNTLPAVINSVATLQMLNEKLRETFDLIIIQGELP